MPVTDMPAVLPQGAGGSRPPPQPSTAREIMPRPQKFGNSAGTRRRQLDPWGPQAPPHAPAGRLHVGNGVGLRWRRLKLWDFSGPPPPPPARPHRSQLDERVTALPWHLRRCRHRFLNATVHRSPSASASETILASYESRRTYLHA